MKIGILDLADDVANTVELGPLVERLGYERYWIAEHQPQPSPMLFATLVAGLTERIRVGTAGILLNYYVPRRAAHDFHLLQRAFSGRIDAGFCNPPSEYAFRDDLLGRDPRAVAEGYGDRVAELVAHVRNTPGSNRYRPELAWSGATDEPPQLWSLGGNLSGDLAARHGVCFAYNYMYKTSADDPAIIARYRARFRAHPTQQEPLAAVAVGLICAETTRKAEDHANVNWNPVIEPRAVGNPSACARALSDIQARYEADEVIIVDVSPTLETRARGLELLASELS